MQPEEKAAIIERIRELKTERNAVILAHNYQRPGVQDVADHLGDSLELAKLAVGIEADVIIFCGVGFMAESAKVLNPSKTVVIPDKNAKCPMAAMATAVDLREFKRQYPGVPVVAYINTTAELKTEVDVCCTSGNAVKVVRSLDSERIIFVPDTNLGLYVQSQVPGKEIVLWPGYCHVHQDITPGMIQEMRAAHPGAEVIVHPECTPDVIDSADHAESTAGMIRRVKGSESTEFILGTEREMGYRLQKLFPDRTFWMLPGAVCPNMKKITLKKVLRSLETLEDEIVLDPEIIAKAHSALERMVAIGRG